MDRTTTKHRILLTLTTAMLAAGCASGAPSSRTVSAPPPGPGPDGMTAAEIEARYQERMDSVRSDHSDADAAFMAGMIHHHAQAVVMSRWAPTHAESPALKTLASRIINAQQDEIRTMRTWLINRGVEAPDPLEDASAGMSMPGMDHGGMAGGHMDAMMPGMLTPAQMEELEATRGAAFDRMFLRYMIQHHSGAVTMVHELFGTDGAGLDDVVFKFASDVQVDQTTEIARMEKLLSTLEGTGSRP